MKENMPEQINLAAEDAINAAKDSIADAAGVWDLAVQASRAYRSKSEHFSPEQFCELENAEGAALDESKRWSESVPRLSDMRRADLRKDDSNGRP